MSAAGEVSAYLPQRNSDLPLLRDRLASPQRHLNLGEFQGSPRLSQRYVGPRLQGELTQPGRSARDVPKQKTRPQPRALPREGGRETAPSGCLLLDLVVKIWSKISAAAWGGGWKRWPHAVSIETCRQGSDLLRPLPTQGGRSQFPRASARARAAARPA